MEHPKTQRACNACKARKVRCSSLPGPCDNCLRRGAECIFSRVKAPRRQNVNTILTLCSQPSLSPTPNQHLAQRPTPPGPPTSANGAATTTAGVETSSFMTRSGRRNGLPELHIDRLLANARTSRGLGVERPVTFKGNELIARGTADMTFFSEGRLSTISSKLGNRKVNDLLRRIQTVVAGRVKPEDPVSMLPMCQTDDTRVSTADAACFVEGYFRDVHPIYPFLHRASFETLVSHPNLQRNLATDPAFSALYHVVLALGCQVQGGGSFEPRKGRAWQIFSVSLSLVPRLVILTDTLMIFQAMTAMAVYSLGISCLTVEHSILSDAARRARNLGNAELTGQAAVSYARAFWVLYSIEKMSSFYYGRSSAFVDCDIISPLPSVPDAVFGDFDWFLIFARHARLLSRALTALFSVGVTGSPRGYFLETIDQLATELEAWRKSVPPQFRPTMDDDASLRARMPHEPSLKRVIVWTQYLYYSFMIILSRATMNLAGKFEGVVEGERQEESKRNMIESSRRILELLKFVDVEPHMSLWVMVGIPLWALFVLFDFVVHHPGHSSTTRNLALLDMAGGHFSQVEYASGDSLPGSLISEFVHIAREYVNDINRPNAIASGPIFQEPMVGVLDLSKPEEASIMESGSISTPNPIQTPPDAPGEPGGLPTFMDTSTTAFVPTPEPQWYVANGNQEMGTDIMNLFTYFIPDGDFDLMSSIGRGS